MAVDCHSTLNLLILIVTVITRLLLRIGITHGLLNQQLGGAIRKKVF